jgi:hypothetical protein
MSDQEQLDFPLDEVVKQANELFANDRDAILFQKFSCENCGRRQTMETPNKFFARGQCEECGHITDLRVKGCNYMVVLPGTPEGRDAVQDILKKDKDK